MNKKIILTMLMLVSVLAFAGTPELPTNYTDRLLICLQPDISVELGNERGATPVTGIVKLDELLSLREITSMERYLPAATADDVSGDIVLANIYRLTPSSGRASLEQLGVEFESLESVLYTEPEIIDRPLYTPNDGRFSDQWFLSKIQALEAWDLWDLVGGEIPGNPDIVLASIDSGVQYTHPDLWQSVWVNQAEIPTSIFDAVDTDNNNTVSPEEVVAYCSDFNADGNVTLQDALHADSPFMDGVDGDDWDDNATSFIDDLFGWDVSGLTSSVDPDNDPMGAIQGYADLSTLMHGTHVAGLLAATTDNTTGIASAIFNGSIMSVKCLYDQDSNGYISGGYSGMLYAAKAGADIINMSWGSSGTSAYSASNQATINVIYETYGSLLVAAAGNGDALGNPTDIPHYPSGYNHVVSVTAVGPGDYFSWANYGSGEGDDYFSGVDLSAPGESILSTIFTTNGTYSSWDGTSMASPIVASSLGLLKAANPGQTNDWLVETLLSTTDPIDDVNPRYIGELGTGRLNVYNALSQSIYPKLSFDSYSLQMVVDNGDGQLAPGEEALMRVNLYNLLGWVDAADVTGVLRSTSPFVIISDSTGAYGSINAGNVGVNIVDRYQFAISEDAPSGQYAFTLELSANQGTDRPYTMTVEFQVEASLWQANFPIMSGAILGGNAVVDIDGDGSQEIIYGDSDSLLHVLQADGTELAGFPVFLNGRLEATPAVGDIDRDGDLEIVIGSRDYNLYVVQHDGSFASIYTSSWYIVAPSSLFDLDQDGDLEIITPTYSGDLAVMHHDGTPFGSFPITLEDYMTVGAAVGDIDGDGHANIVVGTWGDKLHAFNLDGSEIAGFPILLNDKSRSAPVLVNLDGSADGSLEILLGNDDNNFHAYDATGTELWHFNTVGQNIQADPSVCDLDGDGDLEIVFGGFDRNIYVLDHAGQILPGWPVVTGGIIYSSPAIADVDGDGVAEIFIGSNGNRTYGLRLDGTSLSGFPIENTDDVQGSPSIADIDDDGDLEVVIGTDEYVAVLDIATSGDVESYWPTHRGNLYRTGTHVSLIPVSIDNQISRPVQYALHTNYPNPFNPSTRISFDIGEVGLVKLEVLDIRGRTLEILLSKELDPANYSVTWNGTIKGKPASAGIYLYRLSTPDGNFVRKMTLLK